MRKEPIKTLLIEDDVDYALLMVKALSTVREPRFEVERAEELTEGIERLTQGGIDVVLLDLKLADSEGLETLRKVHEQAPKIPIVVLTGVYNESLGTESLKQGAQDYLVKGRLDHYLLARAMVYAIERKHYEEELKAAHAQTEELLASITSILIGVGPSDLITHWNSVAEDVFGIPASMMMNLPFSECSIDWNLERVRACIATCREQNRQITLDDLPFKKPNGEEGFLGLVFNPIGGGSGIPRGVLIFGADITERKRAQEENKRLTEELHQSQKMESLGTLAGGIAHDFKNILGPILGYTELTRKSLPEDSKAYHRLTKVLKCVQRANDLVQQIVAFGRKGEDQKRPVNLTDVVREELELMKAGLAASVTIETSFAQNPGVVLADPTQIHQVVMNLCANAAHAMRERGGKLTVSIDRIFIDEAFTNCEQKLRPGQYIKLSVTDTGVGIPKEVLPRVFEPFFTTKPSGEGSGMGLAAVYGIVTRHQGVILISSEVGIGTTVDVYFPSISASFDPKPLEERNIPLGTEHILLVDDRSEVVDATSELLESLGYRVDKQNDGLQALEHFRRDPSRFDLVVTDQSMPSLTGVKLIRALRALRPDIPIVICTGFSDAESEQTVKALEVNEFLYKPVSISQLANAVRRALTER